MAGPFGEDSVAWTLAVLCSHGKRAGALPAARNPSTSDRSKSCRSSQLSRVSACARPRPRPRRTAPPPRHTRTRTSTPHDKRPTLPRAPRTARDERARLTPDDHAGAHRSLVARGLGAGVAPRAGSWGTRCEKVLARAASLRNPRRFSPPGVFFAEPAHAPAARCARGSRPRPRPRRTVRLHDTRAHPGGSARSRRARVPGTWRVGDASRPSIGSRRARVPGTWRVGDASRPSIGSRRARVSGTWSVGDASRPPNGSRGARVPGNWRVGGALWPPIGSRRARVPGTWRVGDALRALIRPQGALFRVGPRL